MLRPAPCSAPVDYPCRILVKLGRARGWLLSGTVRSLALLLGRGAEFVSSFGVICTSRREDVRLGWTD